MDKYRVKELAKQYTEYPMIRTHTQLPDFPALRTRLLSIFLNADAASHHDSELFSLATSLVQMALDTHDLVDNSSAFLAQSQAHSRQLRILGGDYFSSRFYYLLAQDGHVNMIRQLSHAVSEVNQVKMNLYMRINNRLMTSEEYLQLTVQIKSKLFLVFAEVMKGSFAKQWPGIVCGFTQIEVILQEIERCKSGHGFKNSWGYWHILHVATAEEARLISDMEEGNEQCQPWVEKYQIRFLLEQMLDQQLEKWLSDVQQIESQKVKEEILEMGRNFMDSQSTTKVLK